MESIIFSSVKQLSKTQFLATISKEDHFFGREKYFTRPRKYEILFGSKGSFIILDKTENKEGLHQLKLKMIGKTFTPKFKDMEYLPLKLEQELFTSKLIH